MTVGDVNKKFQLHHRQPGQLHVREVVVILLKNGISFYKNNKHMKMNVTLGVLVATLVISIYFSFQLKNEDEKQAQINSQITADAFFEKKQECASYRPAIEKILAGQNFQNENVNTGTHLDEIWFSPSLNTCLYSVDELWQYIKESKLEYNYSIYDYLGNSLIVNFSEVPGSVSRVDALDAFKKRKEELKK